MSSSNYGILSLTITCLEKFALLSTWVGQMVCALYTSLLYHYYSSNYLFICLLSCFPNPTHLSPQKHSYHTTSWGKDPGGLVFYWISSPMNKSYYIISMPIKLLNIPTPRGKKMFYSFGAGKKEWLHRRIKSSKN